jgi:hypothetical protein
MASVKIDLGFGEQAVLSERAGVGIPTVKHQRDAEEFLRRWPRTRSIDQESGYLQQLGLRVGHNSPGVNPSDTSALLRSAVKSGKITVVIERAATHTGGAVGASQPTMRPYPLEMRQKAAWTAPTATKSYSYTLPESYDDVSADDLIAYLESVVSRTQEAATPAVDSSTPLGDAQPFEYGEDSPLDGMQQDAGLLLTPSEEAECEMQLNADMDECSVWYTAKPSSWGMCRERAMQRYANCLRGLG